jgi:precorrin-3B C17-methyltransferase
MKKHDGRCRDAIEQSDVIAGYSKYVELIAPLYPKKRTIDTPMTRETERCREALGLPLGAKLLPSYAAGPGVYGMAGLIYELSQEFPPIDIEIIPGVTAALAGAAVLGAPLTHDFAVISLSDLLRRGSL